MTGGVRIPDELDIPPRHFQARREHLLREIAEMEACSRPGKILATRSPFRRAYRFRRRSLLAVVLASTLVAAAVAGAASGLLPVGTKLPALSIPGFGEPQYTSERVIVATGSTPERGRWQMTFTESDMGACLGLQMLDEVPPGSSGPDSSEGCGDPSTFSAARSGGGDFGDREWIVFGRASEEAEAVSLTADGDVHITARTHEGPSGVPGDFYLVATPPGLENALVQWFDNEGRAHGPAISVPGTVDYSGGATGPERPH